MRRIQRFDLKRKRLAVITLCAVYMAMPVVADVFPEGMAAVLSAEPVAWAAVPTSIGALDSGAQLNQARDYMERQRVAHLHQNLFYLNNFSLLFLFYQNFLFFVNYLNHNNLSKYYLKKT